jgi:hypothetical protein
MYSFFFAPRMVHFWFVTGRAGPGRAGPGYILFVPACSYLFVPGIVNTKKTKKCSHRDDAEMILLILGNFHE